MAGRNAPPKPLPADFWDAPPRPEPTMQAYDPSWRERLAATMLGTNNARPSETRRRFVGGLLGTTGTPGSEQMGLADFTPAQIPLAINEAHRAKEEGNLGAMAMAASGVIPGARPAATGARALRAAARRAAPAVEGILGGAAPVAEAAIGHNSRAMAADAARELGAGGISGSGTRGMAAVRSLREVPYDEAISHARTEPHLITGPGGDFVGAPKGTKTREDLQRLRDNFDRQTEQGIGGADWYELGKDYNREIAGNDPRLMRRTAQTEALFSSQADPNTNHGFANQAHNAYERGGPFPDIVHTGAQSREYQAAMNEGRDINLGDKTGIYGMNLDPTRNSATTGTNDIWHGRAWGFKNDDGTPWDSAYTQQQHAFLDYETLLAADRANARKLMGRSDWTGPEIQAAPWVAGKGAALHERYPERFPTVEDGIREAQKGYADYAPRYTAQATREQMPGSATGLVVPTGQGEAFSKASQWAKNGGRDPIYSDLGFLGRNTSQGTGAYRNTLGELEHNPVEVARPLIDYKMLKTGGVDAEGKPVAAGKVVNPEMQKVLSAVEAVAGATDAQDAAAWHKLVPDGSGVKNAAGVNLGRMPTGPEMGLLSDIAERQGFGGGAASTDSGATLLFGGKANKAGEAQGLTAKEEASLRADLAQNLPGATVNRGALNSDYIDYTKQWANPGQGDVTRKMMEGYVQPLQEAAPKSHERLLASPAVAEKAGENLDRLGQFGMLGQRPDYEKLLEIMRGGGLKGLKQHIDQFGYKGLPALAGGLALPGLLSESNQQEQQPWNPPGT